MTTPSAPLAARRVAGFRVLRSLARDTEAEVLLGFREQPLNGSGAADGGSEVAGAPEPLGAPVMVALKTMDATPVRWAKTLGALEALERARGDHVVEVLDVECTDELICVVFERLPNGSLAELLGLRERVDAGEVVTIIAPLAAALERMHQAGVGHGAVGPRTVLFRADGAPVLVGFGSSGLFVPGSPEVVLERESVVVADRRALRELACQLLTRVTGPRARAAGGLIAELESCPEPLVLGLLRRRLFEVAAAVPVRFTVDDAEREEREPARVVPIGQPVEDPGASSTPRAGVLVRIIPEAWAQRVLDTVDGSPLAPLAAAVTRTWGGWSPRRRRLALGVGVGIVVLGGALTVIPNSPSASADNAARPSSGPAVSAQPTNAQPTNAQPTNDQPTSDRAASERARATEGDDPLAAASVLLVGRERCLRSLSLLCLDGVDQPDSGALRDDREAVRAAQQGGELSDPLVPDGRELAPELVERLGDSALVRLTEKASDASTPALGSTTGPPREPASLLLVKGEAGWRIRDVIVAPSGGPTG